MRGDLVQCNSYCQKSVKLWTYIIKLLYHNYAYMYRYTMHIHMTVIGYFFIKKMNMYVTCVTHFRYVCHVYEIDLVMDSFLS